MRRALEVERPGPLLTVQDLGRPGLASLGVPESGALDPVALRLANRLVGNEEDAACLEATLGQVALRAHGSLVLAVTGAPVPVQVNGRGHGSDISIPVPDGALVELGAPTRGLRSYVAVRGGLVPDQVLGSASTDLLSGIGDRLEEGSQVAVGPDPDHPVPAVDQAPSRTPTDGVIELRVVFGPRQDWFTKKARRALTGTEWTVDQRSNRVGLRLEGPALQRTRRKVGAELPSEGTVAGSLQVPGNGTPVLFLADHPVTGGYPVIAVVLTEDLPRAAQATPGQRVRLRVVAGPDLPEVGSR